MRVAPRAPAPAAAPPRARRAAARPGPAPGTRSRRAPGPTSAPRRGGTPTSGGPTLRCARGGRAAREGRAKRGCARPMRRAASLAHVGCASAFVALCKQRVALRAAGTERGPRKVLEGRQTQAKTVGIAEPNLERALWPKSGKSATTLVEVGPFLAYFGLSWANESHTSGPMRTPWARCPPPSRAEAADGSDLSTSASDSPLIGRAASWAGSPA